MKKKIGQLFFQIIPVMIGVYLGFLVSNWSEKRKKNHQFEIFLNNLLSEMETNQERLEGIVDYHTMVRDSSQIYSDPSFPIKKANFFRGTRVSKLVSSAYETGIQTGVINELSLDELQAINSLYTFQKDYNAYGGIILSSLINKDFSSEEEDMRKVARFLYVTMTDVVALENGLIGAFKETKGKLTKNDS